MQVGWAEIAILSLYLALVPAVNKPGQVLSTESPVEHGQHTASCDTSLVVSGGVDCQRRRRNVYDKKPQHYTTDNRTTHLTRPSDKSVSYVTNNKRLCSTFCTCTVEANYWQTWSIIRPVCDSGALVTHDWSKLLKPLQHLNKAIACSTEWLTQVNNDSWVVTYVFLSNLVTVSLSGRLISGVITVAL